MKFVFVSGQKSGPVSMEEKERPHRGGLSEIRSGVLIRRLRQPSASCASQAKSQAEALSTWGGYVLLCLGSGAKISGSDTDLMSEFSIRYLRY